MNDEFAKTLSYESVEDLKTKKSEEVTARENAAIKNEYIGKLLEEVEKNTTVEIPVSMVQGEIENRMRELEYQLSAYGFKADDYFKMMGASKEVFAAQIAPSAEKKLKTDLMMKQIAKTENLSATEEELNTRMEELSKMYGMMVCMKLSLKA